MSTFQKCHFLKNYANKNVRVVYFVSIIFIFYFPRLISRMSKMTKINVNF